LTQFGFLIEMGLKFFAEFVLFVAAVGEPTQLAKERGHCTS
jgi:hypothetical protein